MPDPGLTVKERALLATYKTLTRVTPDRLILKARAFQKRADTSYDPTRDREKFGFSDLERPEGRVIWMSSIGPGDSLIAKTLIDALLAQDPDIHVVISTRSDTAKQFLLGRISDTRVHILVSPIDTFGAITRFLDRWQPSDAVFIEGDLWPNTLKILKKRGIRSWLVNAQFEARIGGELRRLKGIGLHMLAQLDHVHVFTKESAARAEQVFAPRTEVIVGSNLKSNAAPLPVSPETLEGIAENWGTAPIWSCVSFIEREIARIFETHMRAKQQIPTLKLILAPRWVEDLSQIVRACEENGLSYSTRQRDTLPTPESDIFIADSYGELGTWFSASFAAFIGSSFPIITEGKSEPGHGHNPYESVVLGTPALAGSYTVKRREDFEYLESLGAAHIAETPEKMAKVLVKLAAKRDEPVQFVQPENTANLLAERILNAH